MAPKAAAPALTPEQAAVRRESARLVEKAESSGMLSKTRRVCHKPSEPSKKLLKACGKDITNKSSNRKNRFLLIFSASIAQQAPGKLGTLCNLDTQNPVMYVDFPEGRLKFCGTLVFPSNKYLMLRLGAKDILCEDVFESMVVFSEVYWVGKKEDNPEERKLPLPEALKERRTHTDTSFEDPMCKGSEASAAAPKDTCTQEEISEDDAEGEKQSRPQPSRPQSSRAAARAAQEVLRADDSGASSGSEEDDEDDDEELKPRVQPLPHSSPDPEDEPKPQGKGSVLSLFAKQMASAKITIKQTGPKPKAPPAKRKKEATAPSSQQKSPSAKPIRKRKDRDSDSDGSPIELDDDEDELSQPPSSQRPQRRAAAAKKTYKLEESEEENDSDASEDSE